jgi:serine/threonine-protein kinase
VLLDKYRVEETLGTGGMGKVVRASHVMLQQQFAIKVLLPHMADSAETVARFLREAQATSALKSEHIARVVDSGRLTDASATPYMVMEYLQGNDLNQILRHHGPQRSQIVCDLMLQACEGMAEAHMLGIVHRDIKPSNFFITTRPDGTLLLKILDFGISKTPVGATELTGSQTVIGTPTYMAPEQMKSGRAADARSDIWSMGVVMYQLLDGRPPFVGESYAELVLKVGSETPPAISTQLPPGLGQVIMTCLEKNPMQRQQTVAELARMLAPYASDPMQGTQSAQRTARILANANRGSARGMATSPLAANGGLAPMSPSQLASKSTAWSSPKTGGSGLSHGRGQVTHTHHVRGGELRIGRLIGAAVVLLLLIGGGIVFARHLLSDDDDTVEPTTEAANHVAAPPPAPEPVKPAVKPEPVVADVKPPQPEPPKETALESETLHTRVESALVPEVEPAKPEPVAVVKPEPKPVVTKPIVKPVVATTKPAVVKKPVVKKKKPRNEELFNSRH